MKRLLFSVLVWLSFCGAALAANTSVPSMTASGAIVGAQLLYCPTATPADFKCTFNQLATFVWASPTFTGVATTAAGTACTSGNQGLVIGADTYGFYQATNQFGLCAAGALKVDYGISSASKVGILNGAVLFDASGNIVLSGGNANISSSGGNTTLGSNAFTYIAALTSTGPAGAFVLSSTGLLGFTDGAAYNGTLDTIQSRAGAAHLQFGAADAASPVAQTISFQNVVAGTTNTAGVNAILIGSLASGNAANGKVIIEVGKTGTTGTAQASPFPMLSINPGTATTATVQFGDGTNFTTYDSCTGLTTGATGVVACTASAIRFKDLYASRPLNLAGLAELRTDVPWRYRDNVGYGLDPSRIHVGLFADEVAKLDERCAVYRHGDPNPADYEDRCVIAYLTAGYIELKVEIDRLKSR